MYSHLVVVSTIVATCLAVKGFPSNFKFGAATAAYQVEGAWNVSDKSPSIWDTFAHEHPEMILDGSSGDVACDSYHLWETDVQLAKKLGLDFYRFSISWPRLLPNGLANHVSEDGARYYNKLIDGLLASGIEPMITLFHWDLPQSLQDLGGWTNPLVADWFAEYARVAFHLFGDRVKIWATLNEPIVICDCAYEAGSIAPGIRSPGIGTYICIKNTMLAHAKAYRIYDEEFRSKYGGKVGIVNNHVWYEPQSPEDEALTELARQFAALYAHPIYSKEGGWPLAAQEFVDTKSKKEGYPNSRLPEFTPEEIELVKGTYDFYGLNYYTSRLVRPAREGEALGAWPSDGNRELGAALVPDASWHAGHAWLVSFPPGIRRQMRWLRDQYGDIEIIITENGYSTPGPGLDDDERVQYFEEHLEQVSLAISEDHVNVTGYTAWSLLDNYEWNSGYTSRFGMIEVDFSSPLRTRTLRASARYYAALIHTHKLDAAR